MKLGTNIHHKSGRYQKGFESQRSTTNHIIIQ